MLGLDGQDGPGADADPVTGLQRHSNGSLNGSAVYLGAVRRAGVEHRPAAVGLSNQDGMQVRDARIGWRPGEIDFRLETTGGAAAANPHFLARKLETALGTVSGKFDRLRLPAAGGH